MELSILLVLAACRKEAPAEGAPEARVPPTAPAAAPIERGEEALLRALSARDVSLPCAELEALVDAPVASLSRVVAEVSAPAAAPMRAARCLVQGHSVEAASTIEGWMTAAGTEGLARLVIEELPQVPVEEARRFAAAGLSGPHAEVLRPLVAASPVPEVRALAE